MQFDDSAIPTGQAMENLRQGYSKLAMPFKNVEILAENQTKNSNLFNLFTKEIKLLNTLADSAKNVSVKEYLKALANKSEEELQRLIKDFPKLDNTLGQNPEFFNKLNSNQNFKVFLQNDLELIGDLASSMLTVSKEDEKKLLFSMLNRHIFALKDLFSVLHLFTFY